MIKVFKPIREAPLCVIAFQKKQHAKIKVFKPSREALLRVLRVLRAQKNSHRYSITRLFAILGW